MESMHRIPVANGYLFMTTEGLKLEVARLNGLLAARQTASQNASQSPCPFSYTAPIQTNKSKVTKPT